jgi:hypothetical protein
MRNSFSQRLSRLEMSPDSKETEREGRGALEWEAIEESVPRTVYRRLPGRTSLRERAIEILTRQTVKGLRQEIKGALTSRASAGGRIMRLFQERQSAWRKTICEKDRFDVRATAAARFSQVDQTDQVHWS